MNRKENVFSEHFLQNVKKEQHIHLAVKAETFIIEFDFLVSVQDPSLFPSCVFEMICEALIGTMF